MKTILVSGGNRGIGREICRQLAAKGHRVLLGARDVEKGRAAAEGMEGSVEVLALDMGSEASMAAAADHVRSQYGCLDVLINNAAIMNGRENTRNVDLAEVRRVMDTNFFGPFRLSQLLAPLLEKAGEGRIVNLSSGMGAHADLEGGGYAPYRLSKAALNDLTILMAADLQQHGISVNAMCPGWVKTEMGGPNAQREVAQGADTAVWLATAASIPSGKFFRDRKEIAW